MTDRSPFTWTQIDPAVITVDAARSAVGVLASLSGSPRIVLEARGEGGTVSWYLGADAAVAARAIRAIGNHLRGLRTRGAGTPEPSTVAGALRIGGHQRVPLGTGATEEAARSVLGALAAARKRELVRLQVILGPRHRPRPIRDVAAAERARLTAKYAEHRFSCEVRIGAKASDEQRARGLVNGVASGLRVLETAGTAIRLKRSSVAALDAVRDPFLWPIELGVSEVTAILGWPISSEKDPVLPGVPSPHPRQLPVPAAVPKTGRPLGVSTLDDERPVATGIEDSKRHLHILGPNGVGKSTLMADLALADIAAGHSVVVIDAKGDLVTDVLARMSPERRDDVAVIDPTDGVPIGVGVFTGDPERDADVVYSVLKSLYDDAIGPRSGNVLHAALVTLARSGTASLSHLPMLLSNPRFRRSIITPVANADPMGLGAFWGWFEGLSDAERVQVVAPIRNKLDPLLTLRPGLRAMFGQTSPKFTFADLFTKKRILLVSLGSAELGPEGSRLLGSLIVALLWHAAALRVQTPVNDRHPVMIHIDEMQEVVRLGDLGDALARARGLGVGFTLAHQSMTQLPKSMADAIMANARNRICFQLSPKDAKDIAATANGTLAPRDFQELPAFTAYASLLTDGNRVPWCSIATTPLPQPIQDPELIRAASRARFGRPIAEVEAELMQAAGLGDESEAPSFGRSRRSRQGEAS